MKRSKIILSIIFVLSIVMTMFLVACNDTHEHIDANVDGKCDVCGATVAIPSHDHEDNDTHEHIDANVDGKCDVCGATVAIPSHDHEDNDNDNKCDTCDLAMYSVVFADGVSVISSVKVVSGSKVEIPDAPINPDSRYTFAGWQGITDKEMESGEVEVFSSNLSYNVKWNESFGTSRVVEIPEIRSLADVTVDGIKDSVYDDVTPIEISSDKTDVTAKAYVMWSKEYFYVFVDVLDSSVNDNDFVELRLELLHTDKYAPSDWDGSWGAFRKNAASEGGWKLKRGSDSTEKYWEYWSHLNDERNSVNGVSVKNDNGYTAEWVIKVEAEGFDSVEEDLVPHIGQQIGMGILINDEGKGWAGIENFNGYNSSAKKLTNTSLVANGKNDPNTIVGNVNSTRAYWNEEDQAIRDRMFTSGRFTDYSVIAVGKSELHALWSESKIYIRPVPGENTKSLVLTVGDDIHTVDLGTPSEIAIAGSYQLNGLFDFSISYKDGDAEEATVSPCIFKLVANPYNRKQYTISKLDGSITIDGVKDEAYDDDGININVVSEGNPSATGVAYFKWSNDYLYVLVEVTDSEVTPADSQKGDPYNNDSVELWINTCRVLPNDDWGNIRPNGDYCGEGGFRVQTNNNKSGQHVMWDWSDGVPRETAVAITDKGWTVEYKIHFSAFAGVENKVGEYIDLMVNINDDDGNDGAREGVTSMNTSGGAAWNQPWVLDRFKLVD